MLIKDNSISVAEKARKDFSPDIIAERVESYFTGIILDQNKIKRALSYLFFENKNEARKRVPVSMLHWLHDSPQFIHKKHLIAKARKDSGTKRFPEF